MKKHLLNRCKSCGGTWFPRGFDLSRKCPHCGSVDVDFTGRIYLGMLALIAVAAGIFWATDRPHRTAPSIATQEVAAEAAKPRHVVRATPTVPPLIATVADGQREALRLFPELGVADSPFNREFVTRYHSYQRLQPDFFQDPAWPVILAKECAAVMGERSKAE
jgi:hypothetical protein